MKKINLKFNLNLKTKTKGTLWQKALLGVILATLVLTLAACAYLLVRPISKEVKAIIDQEISSSDINFDQKTIDNIKARQTPSIVPETSSGKNPFASF